MHAPPNALKRLDGGGFIIEYIFLASRDNDIEKFEKLLDITINLARDNDTVFSTVQQTLEFIKKYDNPTLIKDVTDLEDKLTETYKGLCNASDLINEFSSALRGILVSRLDPSPAVPQLELATEPEEADFDEQEIETNTEALDSEFLDLNVPFSQEELTNWKDELLDSDPNFQRVDGSRVFATYPNLPSDLTHQELFEALQLKLNNFELQDWLIALEKHQNDRLHAHVCLQVASSKRLNLVKSSDRLTVCVRGQKRACRARRVGRGGVGNLVLYVTKEDKNPYTSSGRVFQRSTYHKLARDRLEEVKLFRQYGSDDSVARLAEKTFL